VTARPVAGPLPDAAPPGLGVIAREWGRIGCVGFGGPPAHIALLRELCTRRYSWLSATEFEDGIAATNLLPGPASTQLAIFCAWRVRGVAGALVGGVCFIVPGLILILALASVFLGSPPAWVRGAGAGAGSAVAAVAVQAGVTLIGPSRSRAASYARWTVYLMLGAVSAATIGPWLVLVLLGCGAAEITWRRGRRSAPDGLRVYAWPLLIAAASATGGLAALAWVAIKVGALSYGGGFVIVPLMQADAVNHYHWMTNGQFLNAVALGQATPGPVVQTVAVVGYAAAGVGGGLLASALAFAPSFAFVLGGARRFNRLRGNATARAFLDGAGPAAIGAILGSAIALASALQLDWQYGVLIAAAYALLVRRLGVVATLLGAAGAGLIVGISGGPLPH
jgi:chromate transporter